jgi:hypothetical protein
VEKRVPESVLGREIGIEEEAEEAPYLGRMHPFMMIHKCMFIAH